MNARHALLFFVRVLSIKEGSVCVRMPKTKGRSSPFRLTNPSSSKDANTRARTHKHFSVDKKNQIDVTFVFFISLLIFDQHVSGNHVPIIRS
jgi:hypothetical protein